MEVVSTASPQQRVTPVKHEKHRKQAKAQHRTGELNLCQNVVFWGRGAAAQVGCRYLGNGSRRQPWGDACLVGVLPSVTCVVSPRAIFLLGMLLAPRVVRKAFGDSAGSPASAPGERFPPAEHFCPAWSGQSTAQGITPHRTQSTVGCGKV